MYELLQYNGKLSTKEMWLNAVELLNPVETTREILSELEHWTSFGKSYTIDV